LPVLAADTPSLEVQKICDMLEGDLKSQCEECMSDTNANPAAWTSIGCLEADPNKFLNSLLKIGIGMAGGIAFVLLLLGGFQVMTSAGNPEKLAAGQELISGSITGLLLILFSIFLLRIVSVDILGLPGFSE